MKINLILFNFNKKLETRLKLQVKDHKTTQKRSQKKARYELEMSVTCLKKRRNMSKQ